MAELGGLLRTPFWDGAPLLCRAWAVFFRSLEDSLRQVPERLIAGALLTSAPVLYWTSPANPPTRTEISKLTFANLTGGAVVVSVYLVPVGAAVGDENKLAGESIAAGETWECSAAVGHVLAPGGSIWAACDTDGGANILGSGILVSN